MLLNPPLRSLFLSKAHGSFVQQRYSFAGGVVFMHAGPTLNGVSILIRVIVLFSSVQEEEIAYHKDIHFNSVPGKSSSFPSYIFEQIGK